MPFGTSCLKVLGAPRRHRRIQWSLSKLIKDRELCHCDYSSYQWDHWAKWSVRTCRPKARVDLRIISICEIAAREQGDAMVSTSSRCSILDSGASFNRIGRQHLSKKEVARIRRPRSTIQLTTAADDVESSETVDTYIYIFIYVDDLKMTFTFGVLPEVP